MLFGLFAMWLLGACSNDRSAVQALNQSLDAPTMEQFDAVISYSDSGVVTMRLEAGHLTKEEGEQGGQLFDQGVKVTLLNNDGSIRGGILASTIRQIGESETWVLSGDVHMTHHSGRALMTDSLTWHRDAARITSQTALRLIDGDEEIRGIGLESREDLSQYTIFAVSGELNNPMENTKE